MKRLMLREASLRTLIDKYYMMEPGLIRSIYNVDKTPNKAFVELFIKWWLNSSDTDNFFLGRLGEFIEQFFKKYKTFSLSPNDFKDCTTDTEARNKIDAYWDLTTPILDGVEEGIGELVARKGNLITIYIPTWEASKYFGRIGMGAANAPWCIVNSKNYWESPNYEGFKYYTFDLNNSDERYALIAGDKDNQWSLWDGDNNNLGNDKETVLQKYTKKTGIDSSIIEEHKKEKEEEINKKNLRGVRTWLKMIEVAKKKNDIRILEDEITYKIIMPITKDGRKLLTSLFKKSFRDKIEKYVFLYRFTIDKANCLAGTLEPNGQLCVYETRTGETDYNMPGFFDMIFKLEKLRPFMEKHTILINIFLQYAKASRKGQVLVDDDTEFVVKLRNKEEAGFYGSKKPDSRMPVIFFWVSKQNASHYFALGKNIIEDTYELWAQFEGGYKSGKFNKEEIGPTLEEEKIKESTIEKLFKE